MTFYACVCVRVHVSHEDLWTFVFDCHGVLKCNCLDVELFALSVCMLCHLETRVYTRCALLVLPP
jgi:hypothetical protein